ncbi:MAG: TonB-dependent receptor [candidate division WOR-3 bacterium]
MFPFHLLLFFLFIKGKVYDSLSKSPIRSANVYIADIEKGTSTDSSGHFVILGLLPRSYELTFSHIGYNSKSIKVNLQKKNLSGLKIYLSPRTFNLENEVIVSAKRIRIREEAVTPVTPDLPILIKSSHFLQPDFIRSLYLLPGAHSVNEFNQVPYIAGGGVEQNLFILDGIELYNPFHLSGGYSLIDVDVLRKIDFYPGGFPARYGSRISSVIESEVDERSDNRRELVFGPINSRLLFRHNLEPLSILFAGHFNSFEHYSKLISKVSFPYQFYNTLVKFGFIFPHSWYFSLTGILGKDLYRGTNLMDTTKPYITFDWENKGIICNIFKYWKNISYTLTFGGSHFGSGRSSLRTNFLRINNSINRLSISNKLSYRLFNNFRLLSGFELSQSYFNYLLFLDAMPYYYSGKPLQFSNYLEAELKTGKFLTNLGLRFDHWRGSDYYGFITLNSLSQYYEYTDSLYEIIRQNPSKLLILDSLSFPKVNIVTKTGGVSFNRLSPRCAFKFLLSNNWSITLAGGKYYQFLTMFQPRIGQVIHFYNWLPIFESFVPQEANHLLLELLGFIKSDEIRVSAYYKDFPNLLLSREKIDLLDVQNSLFKTGEGNSLGASLNYQHNAKNFISALNYSFGISKIVLTEGEIWADWDLRHSLSLSLSLTFRKNWELSINQILNSGCPYTPIIGYFKNEHLFTRDASEKKFGYTPLYGWENSSRLPPYSRLDLTIRKNFSKHLSLESKFLNLYNHKNILLYDYDFRCSPPKRDVLFSLPFLFVLNCKLLF